MAPALDFGTYPSRAPGDSQKEGPFASETRYWFAEDTPTTIALPGSRASTCSNAQSISQRTSTNTLPLVSFVIVRHWFATETRTVGSAEGRRKYSSGKHPRTFPL